MNDPNDSTGTGDATPLSQQFLEFCAKVRNNDPSILPEPRKPFIIRDLREKERMELAGALLENTNVTYLALGTAKYTKSSAEAMAKFLRTSKRLQHLGFWMTDDRELRHREEILCCFLPALQESTSLRELSTELPPVGGSSNLAFENMLTHTHCLQSLTLHVGDRLEAKAVAAVRSGLKKNTTLRELTLKVLQGAAIISPLLTSLRDHPLLRRLCLCGHAQDLTGLDTVLLSDSSNISELDIRGLNGGPPMVGLTRVLRALGRHPTLAKLGLRHCRLGRDDARLLGMVLRNTSSLQTLVLTDGTLGGAELAEVAPALYRNASIEMLDMSNNSLNDMVSAEILRDIIRRSKILTTLDLSRNYFGQTTGAVECIVDGLDCNSTLRKIRLSYCILRDVAVTTLIRNLCSRKTTVRKLTLAYNSITATGIRGLLETMEQNSCHITDLNLQGNPIGTMGAGLLARALGKNALPKLTRLSLPFCDIGDDGFIALASALEQNTSLLLLDLCYNRNSEMAFLALAESLPEIKVLQRVVLSWSTGLASAMPLLLEGLRKNTSLFHIYIPYCAPSSVPPTNEETARCAGGWIQEMERLGYRNRFLPLLRAPKEALPPRGVWSHALARVAILPDVIFEVLRSKPNLVPSEDAEGYEAAKDPGVSKKRKRGDE
jgi:hypothetical protein